MLNIPSKLYQITFFLAVASQVFSETVAERTKMFNQQAAATTAKPVLDGKRNPNAVLGKSVKAAEAATIQLFTKHYTEAAHDATYAKRQQVNLWRIKKFQASHTTPTFFDGSTTGVKAKPEHFNPTLDAANIAMAAAYAPYNNCSKINASDVQDFKKRFPHEVANLNLKMLEGDLLPPQNNQAFSYNPWSYGMVLVYRLRHADKLGNEAPEQIDLYNKEKAYEWETAAGIAQESVGTGMSHNKVAAPKSNVTAQPAVTQTELDKARAKLKHGNAPVHPVAAPAAAA